MLSGVSRTCACAPNSIEIRDNPANRMSIALPMTTPKPGRSSQVETLTMKTRRQEVAGGSEEPAPRKRSLRLVATQSIDGTETTETGRHSTVWEPVRREHGSTPTSSEVIDAAHRRPPETLSNGFEQALIATLTRPLTPQEGHSDGAARREHEVAAILLQLNASDAYHLSRRLRLERRNDPVVIAFQRLVIERRQRLRAVLEARRHTLAVTMEAQ